MPAAARPRHRAEGAAAPRADRGRVLRGHHLRLHRGAPRRRSCAADGGARRLVPIANPLSENFAVLRPSLLPGLVDARRAQPAPRTARRAAVRDRRALLDSRAASSGGSRSRGPGGRGPSTGAAATGRSTSSTSRASSSGIGEALRLALDFGQRPRPYLVPGRAASCRARGSPIGVLGPAAPGDRRGARGCPAATTSTSPSSISTRSMPARAGATSQVRGAAALPVDRPRHLDPRRRGVACRARSRDDPGGRARRRSSRVREFDRYQGKGIPDGRYSLSLRLTFRSPDRTLTDAEVQAAMDEDPRRGGPGTPRSTAVKWSVDK